MGVLSDILSEGLDMGAQKTGQGAAELAAALFSGSNAYVQYGEGQSSLDTNRAAEAPVVEQTQAPVMEQQSQGMEM